MPPLEAIRYSRGSLQILDQLLLPQQCRYEEVDSVHQAWKAIRAMKVGCSDRVVGGARPRLEPLTLPTLSSRCAARLQLRSWGASAWPWSCRPELGDRDSPRSLPSCATR